MYLLLLCLSWLIFPLATFGLKGDWACKSALCIAAVVEGNVVHCKLQNRRVLSGRDEVESAHILNLPSVLEMRLTLDTRR